MSLFVMVDYQMPTMTGAELIRKLKLKYQNLKCVMLSGQANKSSVDALKTEKPFSKNSLKNHGMKMNFLIPYAL